MLAPVPICCRFWCCFACCCQGVETVGIMLALSTPFMETLRRRSGTFRSQLARDACCSRECDSDASSLFSLLQTAISLTESDIAGGEGDGVHSQLALFQSALQSLHEHRDVLELWESQLTSTLCGVDATARVRRVNLRCMVYLL